MKKHANMGRVLKLRPIPERVTPEWAEVLSALIRALAGAIIGLIIVGLFAAVIVMIVVAALFGDQSRSTQLLITAITLAGSALGAVLKFFLNRKR